MVKNCLSPVWNSQQQFDWHGEEIIRIDCWDHNKAEEKNNLYIILMYFLPVDVKDRLQ